VNNGSNSSSLRDGSALAWIAALPFLMSWPVLSTFPVFSLLSGSNTLMGTLIQAAFLATGLWGWLSILLMATLLAADASKARWRPDRKIAFAYIVAWTVIYGAYSWWSRG
jgi:hypothetical protein